MSSHCFDLCVPLKYLFDCTYLKCWTYINKNLFLIPICQFLCLFVKSLVWGWSRGPRILWQLLISRNTKKRNNGGAREGVKIPWRHTRTTPYISVSQSFPNFGLRNQTLISVLLLNNCHRFRSTKMNFLFAIVFGLFFKALNLLDIIPLRKHTFHLMLWNIFFVWIFYLMQFSFI